MPTSTGAETIGERLKRLRTDLARVRETIARAESNGQANALGGTAVTEISYERAQVREQKLNSEIAALEARLAGSVVRAGIAQTKTVIES
jgi:hypothetical protein